MITTDKLSFPPCTIPAGSYFSRSIRSLIVSVNVAYTQIQLRRFRAIMRGIVREPVRRRSRFPALFARALSANCRGDLFRVSAERERGPQYVRHRRTSSARWMKSLIGRSPVSGRRFFFLLFLPFPLSSFLRQCSTVNYDGASRCLALIRLRVNKRFAAVPDRETIAICRFSPPFSRLSVSFFLVDYFVASRSSLLSCFAFCEVFSANRLVVYGTDMQRYGIWVIS